MKLTKFIIIFTAVAVAAFPTLGTGKKAAATAAVHAEKVVEHQPEYDGFSIRFDSLPSYQSTKKDKAEDINLEMLDGIASAMTVQASLDYVLRHTNHHNPEWRHSLQSRQRNYSRNYEMRPAMSVTDFFRPVPGGITSLYGWREQFNRMHYGVDLRLNIGDTVRAAISGTVDKIGYDHDGYGNYVVMKHDDGMETLYGHLSYAIVTEGEELLSGDAVGIGGNTGNSTGPHLHFETKIDGIAIDPLELFDFYGNMLYSYEHEHRTPDPEESPAASKKPLDGKRTYVVKYGDTPKSIARRAGISLSKLCQLNMIKTTDRLQVGRMVKLK